MFNVKKVAVVRYLPVVRRSSSTTLFRAVRCRLLRAVAGTVAACSCRIAMAFAVQIAREGANRSTDDITGNPLLRQVFCNEILFQGMCTVCYVIKLKCA
jgi:hypothetical protein